MSKKIISANNVSWFELFELEIRHIIYIFDMLVCSTEFNTRPNDEKTLFKKEACQKCIIETIIRLDRMEKSFSAFADCVREERDFTKEECSFTKDQYDF